MAYHQARLDGHRALRQLPHELEVVSGELLMSPLSG